MAGWTTVAGTHDFVVLDEGQARALAQALAEYGFALVTANPSWHDDGWTVTAFDEGPYSNDVQGRRRWLPAPHRTPSRTPASPQCAT